MKITYITDYDASDIHNASGTGHFIAKTLEEKGCNVDYLTLPKPEPNFLFKLKWVYYKILGKRYHFTREPLYARNFAVLSESFLKSDSDIILCPGTIPIAFLNTDIPIVVYIDASFYGMINFYEVFTNMPKETIENGNFLEKSAFGNSKLVIFSSKWAADDAISNYCLDTSKVAVVPFGANIKSDLLEPEILKIIRGRDKDVLKLLFLGVDWKRKGGETALRTVELLNKRGIKAELHVVGIKNEPLTNVKFVVNHGFVSKSDPNGLVFLRKMLADSHFLILPTVADCTPIVYAEANSFGLPCLTTNVGGIPSLIENGINGMTFSIESSADDYTEYIVDTISRPKDYEGLCLNSFRKYQKELNWESCGSSLITLFKNLLQK